MSEKSLSSSSRRPLRAGLVRRLLRGSQVDGAGGDKLPQEDDGEQHYIEQLRRRLDATPAGPGLKEYDLNSDSFLQSSTDMTQLTSRAPAFTETMQALVEQQRRTHPEKPTFADDADDNPFVSLMHSSAFLSAPTPELDEWLYHNTPQNGYFTPEMVTAAVAGNPNVVVQQQLEDGLSVWRFNDPDGNSFELSRTSDGSKPTVTTRPYLGVHYWTEYDFDTQELVSTPQLGLNSPEQGQYRMFRSSSLADTIKQQLGLQPIRLHQPIDFRGVEAKPAAYLTGPNTELLESVVAQEHVVADLPHHGA